MNVDVFFSLDRGYIPCTLVALFSAAENSSRPLRYSLLVDFDPDLISDPLGRLSAHPGVAEISAQQLDFSAWPDKVFGRFPRAMGGRQLSGRLFEGRSVYLDGDTLVLGDMAELVETDLKGAPVGAVQDTMLLSWFAKSFKGKLLRGPTYRTILRGRADTIAGFRADRYFNSGVMVFDYDRIRALGLQDPMEDLETAGRYRFPDQDHLNSVFTDQVCWLPPEWNGQWSNIETRRRYFDRATRDFFAPSRRASKIVHYVGSKPWVPLNVKRFSRMLGIQQLPELSAMLRMRATYAHWRDRAAAFYGRDPFADPGA